MERYALSAGGRAEARDGWRVIARYRELEEELELCRRAVGWIDVSHLGKLEIQAGVEDLEKLAGEPLELGAATQTEDAVWCPLTPERALVICGPARLAGLRDRLSEAAGALAAPVTVLDVTSIWAALTLIGPQARETFAQFCAVDLRDGSTPVWGLRPGSAARQPGIILRQAEDRFLYLFGWAISGYIWTVVDDAARALGGGPVGIDALATFEAQVPSHA
jgi:glycine cleavage system aminomethyltransferase T